MQVQFIIGMHNEMQIPLEGVQLEKKSKVKKHVLLHGVVSPIPFSPQINQHNWRGKPSNKLSSSMK